MRASLSGRINISLALKFEIFTIPGVLPMLKLPRLFSIPMAFAPFRQAQRNKSELEIEGNAF